MERAYTVQKILKIYNCDVSRDALVKAEKAGHIPSPQRRQSGSIQTRVWGASELPRIGERYGFLRKPSRSLCAAIFTTKGGVLKTTVALNIARMAALHNIRTCVVGLDLQGDITSALGFNSDLEDADDMDVAIERINSARGLGDVFQRASALDEVIQATDLPTLFAIPETADLVALDRGISARPRREYWLREQVIAPLKERFDLIILDCSPNWNQLISNALAACDVLVSPLECKINQFRNLQVFQALTDEYRKELRLNYDHIFVPTRFASTRKLSAEIRSWYLTNVHGVTHGCIRESVQGEESVAAHLSLPEYVPTTLVADEMRELLKEIWERMLVQAKRESEISAPPHALKTGSVESLNAVSA